MDEVRTDKKARSRRRLWKYGAGGTAVAVLLIVGASLLGEAPAVARSELWMDNVVRGDMLREVSGTGTLVPRSIRWLAAETAARVESIDVRPGEQVEPDTVIMRLSSPEVTDQALAARAEFAAAQAEFEAQRARLQSDLLDQRAKQAATESQHLIAQMQSEAESSLVESRIIAPIQAKRSQAAMEQLALGVELERERGTNLARTTAAQLSAARSRVEQKRATAELRARQVDALQVRAGISGVLQQIPVEVGQQVAAGANLARVARPDELMVELRVPESQASGIEIGQSARVEVRGQKVAGKVSRVDPSVRDGTVTVEIAPQSLPAGARADESLDGVVELERLADVLYVARPAAVTPGSDATLFRVGDDGVAKRVPVALGRASASAIEIRGGVQEGDLLILSDMSDWDDADELTLD